MKQDEQTRSGNGAATWPCEVRRMASARRWRHGRRWPVCVMALAVAVGAAACGGTAGTTASSGSGSAITIGGLYPLTGANAQYGKIYVQITNLAVQAVNSDPSLGVKLRPTYVDGQALPGPSVTAMQQLVSVDHAPVVLSGFSAPSKAIAPIANRSQTVEINGGASSPDLGNLGPYMFNDIPLGSAQVKVMVPYVVQTLQKKRWAVLYSSETLGESLLAELNQLVPAAGGKIIKTVSVDPTTTSFQSEVAQIQSVKPDVVFFANTSGGTYPAFLNQEAATGVKTLNVSYDGADIPQVLSDANANGTLFTAQAINLKSDNQATQEFDKKFAAAYGVNATPDSLQVNYYNAVLLTADAISTLRHERKSVSGRAIRSVLESKTFQVVGGPIAFTSSGTLKSPVIQIRKILNGKEEVVRASSG